MPQQFFVHAHRFTFLAHGPIAFPGSAANVVRGALGLALPDADFYFSPKLKGGPSGFADPPRPFVLRAHALNNRTVFPGESFSFDMHTFLLDRTTLRAFASALEQIAEQGLSRVRGRAHLVAIDRLSRERDVAERLFENSKWFAAACDPISINLDNAEGRCARRIAIEFLTPTELKHEDGLAEEPIFPVLFARIRDRIHALSWLYNGSSLDALPELSEASTRVRLTEASLVHTQAERRSSRTAQRHPLGGFTGKAVYEGDLSRFLPWLEAAYWTGVGRQTVWGKGVIQTAILPDDGSAQ
jgi:hypothetical protein